MASKLVIPFNYQPFSVSVKTGAYTIPTGYYAYVTASVQGADSFSIGGVVALQGQVAVAASGTGGVITEVNSTATNTTATFTYTVPAGYKFFWQGVTINNYGSVVETYIDAQSSSGQLVYATTTPDGFASGVYGVHFGKVNGCYPILAPGQIAGVDVNITLSILKRIQGWIERPNSISPGQSAGVVSGNFWVSSGTALTTIGGAYTVTLYPNIS
jgi:hypothetical protein